MVECLFNIKLQAFRITKNTFFIEHLQWLLLSHGRQYHLRIYKINLNIWSFPLISCKPGPQVLLFGCLKSLKTGISSFSLNCPTIPVTWTSVMWSGKKVMLRCKLMIIPMKAKLIMRYNFCAGMLLHDYNV